MRYPFCAAASIFVSLALISQALGVLRPLFPVKAAPPFSSELVPDKVRDAEQKKKEAYDESNVGPLDRCAGSDHRGLFEH
jgi:hypothetical protein